MPDRVASQSSYLSSVVVAILGVITSTSWPVLFGTVVAAVTAGVNWYYKRAAYKLDERRTRAIELAKSLVVIDQPEE